jgi:hypothetical protein
MVKEMELKEKLESSQVLLVTRKDNKDFMNNMTKLSKMLVQICMKRKISRKRKCKN